MSEQSKPIILVDGSSYLFRAFFALPALANSKNFPTGAIYGVINMLRKLITDYKPSQMGVVFDTKGKTFRDDIYSEYKANRNEMPDELAQQIKPLHKIIQAMGLPLIMVEGVEADDVIGTLAHEATEKKQDVIISTGDKDIAQLVNGHITLINTMNNTVLDTKGVENKFGVPPNLIIDYLTLVGDTSDNIPGVPKVGPKTAVKWLTQYGSLDNIVKHADEIKGKVGENLRNFIDQIPMTRSLVTIKCDVDMPVALSDLTIKEADKNALINHYREMEFKNWLAESLDGETTNDIKTIKRKKSYDIITKQTDFDKWLKKLEKAKLLAFDTETTSLNYMDAELVGVSFAIKADESAYVPFGHDYAGAPTQLKKEGVLKALAPILANPDIKKIGQNIKYDMEVLGNAGIKVAGVAFDTMLESYVIDSASNNHSMDNLALKYLGVKTIKYEDVAGKGAKQIPFNQVPLETAGEYAAEDADITLQLHENLWPRVKKEKGLTYIFENIEMPLIPVLAHIEMNGVLIDPDKLRKQSKELQSRLDELEKDAFNLAGNEFNLNSPKQLQEILFDKLKLPILKKTPKGQPSTAEAVLQELAVDFEIPRLIIEYRSLSKLISTYTSKLPEQINAKTNRVHTSYNQTVTATGRLSSSDPNLQNIPIRSKEGRRIREAFIAPKGHKLVSADYSQIELRIMAHISQDKNLLKAFANNHDVHRATAAEVWGVPYDEVTNDMRRHAKAINFGLIYGMSAHGLSKQIGADHKTAQHYIDTYFKRYPGVHAYMENTREKAHKEGFVETLWGRRLYLPEINSKQIPRQKAAERAAINAPLQGSAADIIKIAMIHIEKWLNESHVDVKMIMQVHDELVFEVPDDKVDEFSKIIENYMCDPIKLDVPILVSVGVGDNWDKASDH